MDELFRFAVVRATTKSVPNVASLSESAAIGRPPTTNVPPPTFQQKLNAAAAPVALKNGTGEQIWSALEPVAIDFVVANSDAIVANPVWSALGDWLDRLRALAAPASTTPLTEAAVHATLDANAALATEAAAFVATLNDDFLALLILRRGGPNTIAALSNAKPPNAVVPVLARAPALREIGDRIGVAALLAAGLVPLIARVDASLTEDARRAAFTAALDAALDKTFILPPPLQGVLRKPTLGLGFRELHVVRQNIRRYEAAELARIENILKGESRDHSTNHSLSTRTDTTVTSNDASDTNSALTTDDHTDVRSEAEALTKMDTKLDAGYHSKESAPTFSLETNMSLSVANADQNARKYASDTAKNVTKVASSRVTNSVMRSQTTRVVEEFEEHDRQAFDNKAGAANVAGVYQWVQKVYLSQVFNLGRHLLIDLSVPEPGANLLAQATITSAQSTPPLQPHPLGTIKADANGKPVLDGNGQQQLDVPLNPLAISPNALIGANPDPNFYGTWIARYNATNVDPPPDARRTYSQPKVFPYIDDNDPSQSGQIEVEDGYGATAVVVKATAMRNDNPDGNGAMQGRVWVDVTIGGSVVHMPWTDDSRTLDLSGTTQLSVPATGTVSFTVYGRQVNQMSVSVELVASPLPSALDRWRLSTYQRIVEAFQAQQQAYQTALAAMKMATQVVGPLGAADPDANRLTERIELKRSSIAILDNDNHTVAGTIAAMALPALPPGQADAAPDPTNPRLPETILAIAQTLGFRIRWFEQAFEWENMAYVLYPYFWGRRERWIPGLMLENPDPSFLQFLQSGYARVVLPVRPGFERAVLFYLATGLPWLGGDITSIGSDGNPLYLDAAEEIKALTDSGADGSIDKPVGDPWEYTVATTLVKLRDDGALPEWHRTGPDGSESPDFPSNEPAGDWTWIDGAPAIEP